ncbi:MAG TPA: sigma-70 family RNA polymerase sigma factor, partial [Candidatus Nitrosotalea sp.]|nr:sigma-70 family RNA polymerase sigma factor [Candidatus Nitrosotalea sp.]
REHLVGEYWYLCRRAAARFMRRGLDRADLEQIAAIGLIKAADRYDASLGTPFEAYAWVLILGELMHYARDGDRFVRAPRGLRELAGRWSRAECALRSALGREPDENDVARFLRVTEAQLRELRSYRASDNVLSFERLMQWEDPLAAASFDDLLDRLTLDRMLAALPPLEREIVVAIHLRGTSVVDLSKRLGYSRRHVTRLHALAMRRLKRTSEVGAPRCGEQDCDVSVSYGG